MKNRVVTKMSIAIFRFNHKLFSSEKKFGKNCKITSKKSTSKLYHKKKEIRQKLQNYIEKSTYILKSDIYDAVYKFATLKQE